MKIGCECGGVIFDQTDFLPNKAYIIPDQDWFKFLEAIDQAVTFSGATSGEKEKALMKVRKLATTLSKMVWQCNDCGRLYIDAENNELVSFKPNSEDDPIPVLMSRKSTTSNA